MRGSIREYAMSANKLATTKAVDSMRVNAIITG